MPSKDHNPDESKREALRQQGTLNPRPRDVTHPLFQDSEFFDARDLVQVKYEMLREVQVEDRPVSQSATAFGFSRPSFYQAQSAYAQGGLSGLVPRKRGPRGAHKLTPEVMGAQAAQEVAPVRHASALRQPAPAGPARRWSSGHRPCDTFP